MKHPIPPEQEPLSALDIENLERATLDAVAPQSVQEIGQWLLPFDDSNIGRAISAVPLSHFEPSELSAAEQVDQIQAQYSQRGKRCAFRLAAAPGLAAIHARLALLGYTAQQPTLVQTGSARHKLEPWWRQVAHWRHGFTPPPVPSGHRSIWRRALTLSTGPNGCRL